MAGKKNCGKCKKPKSQCKCGRPTVVTPDVVCKLEAAFSDRATDLEACLEAGISKHALYAYEKKHPEFTDRKELLKSSVGLKAKRVMITAIDKNDKDAAKWWLERCCKDEFNTTVNVDLMSGGEKISIGIHAFQGNL